MYISYYRIVSQGNWKRHFKFEYRRQILSGWCADYFKIDDNLFPVTLNLLEATAVTVFIKCNRMHNSRMLMICEHFIVIAWAVKVKFVWLPCIVVSKVVYWNNFRQFFVLVVAQVLKFRIFCFFNDIMISYWGKII